MHATNMTKSAFTTVNS